jgi:hypothetical protein
MLKLITLAACVFGFIFLGPKALAEFRRARPGSRTVPSRDAGKSSTEDKSGSDVAA